MRRLGLGACCLLSLLAASPTWAAAAPPVPLGVPWLIQHEGLLLDPQGGPAVGARSIRFSLYLQAQGGAPVWSEVHQVELEDGYYGALLGESTDLQGIDLSVPLYLGITVGQAAEIAPRRRLLSVPFVFQAANATGAISPRTVAVAGGTVIDEDGNWVGPGATDEVAYASVQELLDALAGVGGDGSGIDSDTVDGWHAEEILVDEQRLLEMLLSAGGAGSGIDVDTVDGRHAEDLVSEGWQLLDLLSDRDGAGSSLDLDRLDGADAANFMRADGDTGTVGSVLVLGTTAAAEPVDASHAATRRYVDGVLGGGPSFACAPGPGGAATQVLRGFDAAGDPLCTDIALPYVLSAEPSTGAPAGGEQVTLTGGNFLAGAQVFVGGVAARAVQFVDARTLRVTSPGGDAGTVAAITVVNPGGNGSTLSLAFGFSAAASEEEPQEGALRLAGGASPLEGRVEILHDGQWGTICDDAWGMEEATVVCRQLGLGAALEAPCCAGDAQNPWGEGVDPIWMDDLQCTGNEARLDTCAFAGWGNHNCSHWEDAAVVCQGAVVPQ